MIKMNYAVVTYKPPQPIERPLFRAGTFATAAEEGTLGVSHVTASPEEAADLGETENTTIAPVMPLRLVEPLSSAARAAAGPTWGVQAIGADTTPFDGSGVTVAVLDTGIDASHPAFADVTLEQRDFTGEGEKDEDGHGTHCAGTVFGRDVAGTRIGVARGVERALIGKVLGSRGGTTASILDAISWALAEGAEVISMSLGLDYPGMVEQLRDQGIPSEAATSMALAAYRDNIRLFDTLAGLSTKVGPFGRGAVLCAAAGNESRRLARSPGEKTYVIEKAPPATATGIVSVGAVGTATGGGYDVAWFSNSNPDIAGPGVDVVSAVPGGGLGALSGTSMATPHVAGAAALWAQKLSERGAFRVDLMQSNLVARTAPIGLPLADVGSGLVQAPQS